MCGINGFNFIDEKQIKLMNKAILHRGPNDNGVYFDNNLSIGQVRLSIVDVSSAGSQPMFYSKSKGASNTKFNKNDVCNSDYSIVFNGEIYNYVELKDSLSKEGYNFTTNSDTEVILAAYDKWGENCVNKFNGMWAFCIFNKRINKLFLSRDRFGVKPLYYYLKNNKFIFSSELKGILAHENLNINLIENISKEAVELYFATGFVPSPICIYRDCYKLEAGHNLIFNTKTKKIEKKSRYYEIPDFKPMYNKKKLVKEGKELFKNAVKIRMRSDVPIGAFLSGGIDSSSVVGYMKYFTKLDNLHTFSIGFASKEYDETNYINIIKDYYKTVHHHYMFKEKDFQALINDFSYIYDEPFWDYSGYAIMKLSNIAKKNATVVLSGDGGDEIFAGYNAHLTGARFDLIKKIPSFIRLFVSKIPAKKRLNSFMSFYLLKEAMKLSFKKTENFYSDAISDTRYLPSSFKKWSRENMKFALKKGNNKLSEALRIYDLKFNTLSDNFLVKVDRASMINGIEVRSPFLDYRLVEFSQRIPSKYKVDIFRTKKILRKIVKDILPRKILTRNKQGFEPPLDKWILDSEYMTEIRKNLEKLYEKEIITKELYDFYKNKVFLNSNKLYDIYKIKLFLFVSWIKQWGIGYNEND